MTRTTRPARVINALLATALAVALLALAGCGSQGPTAEEPAGPAVSSLSFPVTVTDDASRTVTIESRPERIVSLAPANTEILFALGAGDRVVGVTSYDDYPAEVADIAKVGDFAGPNMEAVAAADADLVLVTTGVQADIIAKLEEMGATVVALDPQTLDGVYEDITEVASMVDEVEAGNALVEAMKGDAAEIEAALEGVEPRSAFIEVGQNPLFTVGASTLLDDLLRRAGGTNVVAEPGYVAYSSERLVADDPAVYLATKSSGTDAASLAKRPGYAGLTAVKTGRVVILDDNLVSRPGPRIVEGLRLIADGIHPEAFGK